MTSKARPANSNSHISGIVCVDKPAGMTSHDVVNRVRRIFGQKRVGHTGTLDPMATGVLVICLGQATRIVEYLTASNKVYEAGMILGLSTDSEDITGQPLSESDAAAITEEQIRAILPRFTGKIKQVPPMISAIHHEGKRLYELAREGKTVEREPREVEVFRLEMISFTPGSRAKAEVVVECSTGTYIRTLAADIGTGLNVGGAMSSLRRTRVGEFELSSCHTLEELAGLKEAGALTRAVRSIQEALSSWFALKLMPAERNRILQGQRIDFPRESQLTDGTPLLLLDQSDVEIAIGEKRGAQIAPIKVFSQPECSEV